MTATEVLIDAIRVNAHNIPRGTPKVAGYVTGTGAVPWTTTQWDYFARAGHVCIDQSPTLATFSAGDADVADVEPFAGTIGSFVNAVRTRIAAGTSERWSTIYGTDATMAAAAAQLQSTLTLAEAQVDLSAAEDTWHPAPSSSSSPPA